MKISIIFLFLAATAAVGIAGAPEQPGTTSRQVFTVA